MMKKNNINQTTKKQKGFTLIEILIVIAIISILAGVAVSSFSDKPGVARQSSAKLSIRNISNALKIYRLDNITYPTTSEGLSVLVPKYLDKLNKDPWGVEYKYIGNGTTFELYSYGADKTGGGTGENADIGKK